MFFLPSLRGDFSFFFYCSLIHGNLLATYTPLIKYYLNTVYLLLFWDWISKGEKCMDEFWTKFISSRLHVLTTDIYNLKSGVWEKKKDPCTSQRSSRHWYQLDLLFFFFLICTLQEVLGRQIKRVIAPWRDLSGCFDSTMFSPKLIIIPWACWYF